MISWQDGDGALHRGSLFGVFAALARGEAWSFPALRPHQREPWHAFTVQVAAMALIRAGVDTPPADEDTWRELLVALSDGSAEAWELVVDDWSKPALLQPPVVAVRRADYKNPIATPDVIDILVTSKNHDVKQGSIVEASAEHWLFALVTLQTSAAYGGAKTYGVSRMNGKTGSRLIARVRPPGGSGATFWRDVVLLTAFAQAEKDMRSLLWLEPNDGQISISYATLAPSLYIDCARRIRLTDINGSIRANYATADQPRVNAEAAAGVTGDPYAPIKPDRTASVTPKRETFGYRGLAKLLSAAPPLLAHVHPTDRQEGTKISFSALVRRGGTDTNTEGMFEQVIRTSRVDEIEETGDVTVSDRIGDTAIARAKEAGEASDKLRYALYALLQGAPSEPGQSKRLAVRSNDNASIARAKEWTSLFDQHVRSIFFEHAFWSEAVGDDVDHRRVWRERLRDLAIEVFAKAAEAAPRTEMRRIRAIARGKSLLEGQMRKWLEQLA